MFHHIFHDFPLPPGLPTELPTASARSAFGQRRAPRCIKARDQDEQSAEEAEDDVDQVQSHGELLG